MFYGPTKKIHGNWVWPCVRWRKKPWLKQYMDKGGRQDKGEGHLNNPFLELNCFASTPPTEKGHILTGELLARVKSGC